MKTITFTVSDPVGLHARPASKLVQEANLFSSNIVLSYNGESQDLKSIFGVLGLAIPSNATVEIHIDGPDEIYAYSHLSMFIHTI